MLGMFLILLGVALWSATHLLPAVAPERRAAAVAAIGDKPWRGVASGAILLSIVLIVQGWDDAASAGLLYVPPAWGVHVNNLLMLVAFLLLGAGHAKSVIARHVRHPMLSAVALWSVAHLLANGEARSVLLFAGLGGWAVAAMIAINRRDGPAERPATASMRGNLIHVGVSLILFIAVLAIHPWLFGVSPLPM